MCDRLFSKMASMTFLLVPQLGGVQTSAVHPYNGIVFSNGKEEILIYSVNNTDVHCILLSENSLDSKDHILHDSFYMAFWKRQTRGIEK